MNRVWTLMALAIATTPAFGAGAERSAPTLPGSSSKAEYIGAKTCIGCHARMESFKHNVHGTSLLKAKGIEFSRSCETCHGPGSLHAGAMGSKDNPDFFTIRNPSKSDSSSLCLQCHEGGRRMHWKGSSHDLSRLTCMSCHSMHKEEVNHGKGPLLGKAFPMETCFQCHPEKKAQIRKSSHMPLVEGKMGCAACHNPHGSATERLLAKNTVTETCYQCHQDKRGPFLFDHAPARENCATCHEPHGSHNDNMLVTRAPLLCQRCHVAGGHTSLPYGVTDANNEKPFLFYKGCSNCHPQVHGSNHPSGKWLMR